MHIHTGGKIRFPTSRGFFIKVQTSNPGESSMSQDKKVQSLSEYRRKTWKKELKPLGASGMMENFPVGID